ncbi:MAG: hypothetical protein ACYS9X_29970 [Planctomycetota bacterium]
MKRAAIAFVGGALLAYGSICLKLLAYVFSPNGPHLNRNLRLSWFLGGALQGIVVSVVWLLALQYLRPSASLRRMLLVVGVVFVFAVALPCPSILNGSWGDDLTGVYAILVWVGTALCVWVSPFGRGQGGEGAEVEPPAES